MPTKVTPNPSLTDLAEFYKAGLPHEFQEPILTIKLRLIQAIQLQLAFYTVNWHTGKVTTVIFGEPSPDNGVMVLGYVGRKEDLPIIYKQFRSYWPNVQYLTGYRKNKKRQLILTTEFLDRKLKLK